MRFPLSLSLSLSLLLLSSCGKAEFEYNSPHQCYFVFRNDIHQNSLLATALTPNSNIFIKISKGTEVVQGKPINYIYLSTSDKQPSDKVAITTDIENYQTYELGANNGIIVGYNVFDQKFVAFDAQCRNCYSAMSSCPLSWTNNTSEVKCSKCGRTYSLYNGNVSSGDGGDRLWEYRVSCTGQYGALTVVK